MRATGYVANEKKVRTEKVRKGAVWAWNVRCLGGTAGWGAGLRQPV